MKKFLGILLSGLLLTPVLALAQTTGNGNGYGFGHYHNSSSTPQGLLGGRGHASTTLTSLLKTGSVTGTVSSAISGTTINLTGNNSTSYTIDASAAKIVRKFGATMAITDIAVGDTLQVYGTVSGTNVSATIIRDNSQQQKNATFSGSVTGVNAPSFTIQSKSRGTQTVNTTGSTTFKESGQTGVSLNNVTTGENVIVTGIWDSTGKTVAAATVTIVVKTGSVSGTLSSPPSGTTLTVTATKASSTVYSVDASNAKFVRRYGAAMGIGNLQVGDSLTITGIINGFNVTAKIIRDNSLQAYNGTFTGTITAVNSDGSFVLQSKSRGNQTINVTSSTIYKLGSQAASSTVVASGQMATVSGVWDRTASNVTAKRVVIKVSSTTLTGTLTNIAGTILTVTNASSTAYSVDASKAKVRFMHSHSGSLSNFQVNDQVKVWGSSVSGSTSIMASIVQDLSRMYNATSTPPQQ